MQITFAKVQQAVWGCENSEKLREKHRRVWLDSVRLCQLEILGEGARELAYVIGRRLS
jgi:hypothetical protein